MANAGGLGVRLSAVAIMRNEALNLPGLIANLRGVVDEIVLVDDGSTDASLAIAEEAGEFVRVVDRRMEPGEGFAGQRNAGIEAARGAWLLHMDCDERVSPALAHEIGEAVRETGRNAFRYSRLNYFLHRPMRHGGWDSWNNPQLARKGRHRFEGAVHERCVVEGGPEAIGQLSAPMHHLNDEDFAKRLRKSAQYVGLEVERARTAGRRVSGWSIARRTAAEFAKKYIAKQGFRDGTPGLIAALHAATAVFRIEATLWDEQNRIAREDLEARVSDTESRR